MDGAERAGFVVEASRAVDEDVIAVAAVEAIDAGAGDQDVATARCLQCVVASSSKQDVRLPAALQVVVTFAAVQPALQRYVARADAIAAGLDDYLRGREQG